MIPRENGSRPRRRCRALLPWLLAILCSPLTVFAEEPMADRGLVVWLASDPVPGLDSALLDAVPSARSNPPPRALSHVGAGSRAFLDALADDVARELAVAEATHRETCGEGGEDPTQILDAVSNALMFLDLETARGALDRFGSACRCGSRPIERDEVAQALLLEGVLAFRAGGDPLSWLRSSRVISRAALLPEWAHEAPLHEAFRQAGRAAAEASPAPVRLVPPGPAAWRLVVDGEVLPPETLTRQLDPGAHLVQIVDAEGRALAGELVELLPGRGEVVWPPADLLPPTGRAILAALADEMEFLGARRWMEPTRKALLAAGWGWVAFAAPSGWGDRLHLSWGDSSGVVRDDVLVLRRPLDEVSCVRQEHRQAAALGGASLVSVLASGAASYVLSTREGLDVDGTRTLIGARYVTLGLGVGFALGTGWTLAGGCDDLPTWEGPLTLWSPNVWRTP